MTLTSKNWRLESCAIERLRANPANIRTTAPHDEAEFRESVRQEGIKQPLLGYDEQEAIFILDGHRRLEAALAAKLPTVPVVIYPQRPDEAEQLRGQLIVNEHRSCLNPVDCYEAYAKLARLRSWNNTQLAAALAIDPAKVTRILSLGKLTAAQRELVRQGKLALTTAYTLSRYDEKERESLVAQALAGEATRDSLSARARRPRPASSAALKRIQCALPVGKILVQSRQKLDLSGLIDLLDQLARECRKARQRGWDISTALKVFKDTAVHTTSPLATSENGHEPS